MSLIINKIRNLLNSINVDKLTFIHINKYVMHWPKEKKHGSSTDEIKNINEKHLSNEK